MGDINTENTEKRDNKIGWQSILSAGSGILGTLTNTYNSSSRLNGNGEDIYSTIINNNNTSISSNSIEDYLATINNSPTSLGYVTARGVRGKGQGLGIANGVLSGAAAGAVAGPWGALAGAAVGAGTGLAGLITGNKAARRSASLLNDSIAATNDRLAAQRSLATAQTVNNVYNNNMRNIAAFGGDLMTNGATWDSGITYIGNGGSHESNPYEGVPIGVDPQGTPNLVEEGEVLWDDYVFSKRLKVPNSFRKKYKLSSGGPLSFAEAAEKFSEEGEERPNDPISKRGRNTLLTALKDVQEQVRIKKQQKEAKDQFNNMSPEEQLGVMQMAQQTNNNQIQEAPVMAAYGGNLFKDGGDKYSRILKLITTTPFEGHTLNEFLTYFDPEEEIDSNDSKLINWLKALDLNEFIQKDGSIDVDALNKNSILGNRKKGYNLLSRLNSQFYNPKQMGFSYLNIGNISDTLHEAVVEAPKRGVSEETPPQKEVIIPKDRKGATALTRRYPRAWFEGEAKALGFNLGDNFQWDYQNAYTNLDRANAIYAEDQRQKAYEAYVKGQKAAWEKDALDSGRYKKSDDGNNIYKALYYTGDEGDYINSKGTRINEENYNALKDAQKSAYKKIPAVKGDFQRDYNNNIIYGTDNVSSSWIPKDDELGKDFKWDPKNAAKLSYDPDNTMSPLTALRFAPALGGAIGVFTDALGLTNKPDYTDVNRVLSAASNTGKFTPIRGEFLGNYLRYNPLDVNNSYNILTQQGTATNRNIANTSGGNRAAMLASQSNAAYNTQVAMSNALRQSMEYNDALNQKVTEFKRGTDQFNATQASDVAKSNLTASLNSKSSYLNGAVQAATLREKENTAANAGRSTNLTNFFNSLGQIGEETYDRDTIEALINRGVLKDLYGNIGSKTNTTNTNNIKAKGGRLLTKRKYK